MTCFTQYFMLALPKKYSFLSGILSAFLLGLPKNSSFIRGILSTCTHFFPQRYSTLYWNSFFSPCQKKTASHVEFFLLALPKNSCLLSGIYSTRLAKISLLPIMVEFFLLGLSRMIGFCLFFFVFYLVSYRCFTLYMYS